MCRGKLIGGGGGSPCVEPCPEALFTPYIVNQSSLGTATPTIGFYLPLGALSNCDALSDITVTVDGDVLIGSCFTTGNLYDCEREIGTNGAEIPTGSANWTVGVLPAGDIDFRIQFDRGAQVGNTCQFVDETITFNTENIPRVSEDVCNVLENVCSIGDFWSAVTLTRLNATEFHAEVDSAALFGLGCLDGSRAWIDFKTNAAPPFSAAIDINSSSPTIQTIAIPANASPSFTTLTMKVTTGPDLPITYPNNSVGIWTPPVCDIDVVNLPIDIGTIPAYVP